MKKYKDDLFAIIGGWSCLYFATLDPELAWFWNVAGYSLVAWGIMTFCLHFKTGK